MSEPRTVFLGDLQARKRAKIIRVGKTAACQCADGKCDPVVGRLLELGFIEGSEIEVIHRAPFGGDPIAVHVRGAILALRIEEANHAIVEEV